MTKKTKISNPIRVGTVCAIDNEHKIIYSYGYGMYSHNTFIESKIEGDESMGFVPLFVMDNGDTILGVECHFCPENEMRDLFLKKESQGYTIKNIKKSDFFNKFGEGG